MERETERIGTLVIKGEDSVRMCRELFMPSRETIRHWAEKSREIAKGITIKDTEDGFIAYFDDLDLSFLDEEKELKRKEKKENGSDNRPVR